MSKIQDVDELDFPSGKVEFDLNEIERPLRRKPKGEWDMPWYIPVILLLIALTLLSALVSRITDDQAHAAEVSMESTYSTLCVQYRADSELVGTAAEETINQICN